jgi:hypothetical protein
VCFWGKIYLLFLGGDHQWEKREYEQHNNTKIGNLNESVENRSWTKSTYLNAIDMYLDGIPPKNPITGISPKIPFIIHHIIYIYDYVYIYNMNIYIYLYNTWIYIYIYKSPIVNPNIKISHFPHKTPEIRGSEGAMVAMELFERLRRYPNSRWRRHGIFRDVYRDDHHHIRWISVSIIVFYGEFTINQRNNMVHLVHLVHFGWVKASNP